MAFLDDHPVAVHLLRAVDQPNTFEALRQARQPYVDRTENIEKLLQYYVYRHYLCRGPGSGHTMLLDTIESLLAGHRQYFEGLKAEQLDHDWQPTSVVHLDFGGCNSSKELDAYLRRTFEQWEQTVGYAYNSRYDSDTYYGYRYHLQHILYCCGPQERQKIGEQRWHLRSALLIDNYDHPLMATWGSDDYLKAVDILRDVLSLLYNQPYEVPLDFCLLTGRVPFIGQLERSMDHLNDANDEEERRTGRLSGFSSEEALATFGTELQDKAEQLGCSLQEAIEQAQQWCGGYRLVDGPEAETRWLNPWGFLHWLRDTEPLHPWSQLQHELKPFAKDIKKHFAYERKWYIERASYRAPEDRKPFKPFETFADFWYRHQILLHFAPDDMFNRLNVGLLLLNMDVLAPVPEKRERGYGHETATLRPANEAMRQLLEQLCGPQVVKMPEPKPKKRSKS